MIYSERNLKLLSSKQPEVYKTMFEQARLEFPQYNVGFGKNDKDIVDNVVIKIGEQLFAAGKEDEAKIWIQNINPDTHTIIVFGLAMGYHTDQLIEKFPDKKIIIIEPDKRIIAHAFHLRDFEDIINHCTIWTDMPVVEVNMRIYELITHPLARGIQVLPYWAIYREYSDELFGFLKKITNDWAVMVNTKRCLADKWYANRIANAHQPSVNAKSLIDKFKDIPAVLVGAGPSLKEHIPMLKELQGKAVIVAAGTAIEILLHNGITPTFMTGIDQDPVSEGGLHENLEADVPLMFDGQVAQNSLYYKGKKFQMQLNVNKYTGMITPDLPVIESGPSIACVSLDILYKLGCSPILMTGMDLSYPYGKLYCDGTQFQEEKNTMDNLVKITNNRGNVVGTEPSFLSMANWFEEYVPRIKPQFTNCTFEGLVFKNIPWKSLDECTKDFTQEYDFKSMIDECYYKDGNPDYIDLSTVDKINEEIYQELEQMKPMLENGLPINAFKSFILIDEFASMTIYLEEILSEARIKKGMDKGESIKMFNEKRKSILLDSINKIQKMLKPC